MKVIREHVSSGKKKVLAEVDNMSSAKALQQVFLKEIYDHDKYDKFIVYIE